MEFVTRLQSKQIKKLKQKVGELVLDMDILRVRVSAHRERPDRPIVNTGIGAS